MQIRGDVLDGVEQHAREAGDEECCGLLLGTAGLITQGVRVQNISSDPGRRYEIDAAEYFAAIRQARTHELEVVGAYHSHPRSEPIPSPTDLAEAFENFVFLIVGRAEGQARSTAAKRPTAFVCRAWRLVSGNFVELPFVRLP